MSKADKIWKKVRNTWISRKPVLPGVWQRKEGGHVARGRVKDPTTGKMKDLWKVLPQAAAAEALTTLTLEIERVRAGNVSHQLQKPRFSEFASSLFDKKVKVREIKSAAGRQKWAAVLEHLIAGTKGKQSGKRVSGFGDMFIDAIRAKHIEDWKVSVAALILEGDYSPTTVNGWLAILRVIMKAAKREFDLPQLATEGLQDFDESEQETYTEEEPNALLPEEVAGFMSKLLELHPAHFAMVYVGLVTGLRPSTLRPLRRKGETVDVLWEKNRLLVRRSQTVGNETMRTTKQNSRYPIDLPEQVMRILQWHVDTQLRTPEQKDSDLLFPSVTGGFRAPTVLNKPLADVAEELGLGKRFTQRGLRRTFNDLARAAQVNDLVTRSISGHQTERMQQHYSTVNPEEQRSALAKVIRLVDARPSAHQTGSHADPLISAPAAERSGEHGGEHFPRSGEQMKKAGQRVSLTG